MTVKEENKLEKCHFLLEIGVEEIPSALIEGIADYIEDEIKKVLLENKLSFKESIKLNSPRRLFFEIKELDSASADEELILRGPPEKIAVKEKDGEKKFTLAALGFAKKNELTEKDLEIKDGYVYASTVKKGKATKEILEDKIAGIIKKTPGKRFMRWADTDAKFTRPIEWINASLLNANSLEKELVEISFEDIKSSDLSFGHRVYGKNSFQISNQKNYLAKLAEENIILDPQERKNYIRKASSELAETVKGVPLIDYDLLDEICGLVESPKAILCEFSKDYLEVPGLVLSTVMKVHQRYIPVASETNHDELLPYFIVISNNPEASAEENIKKGNEKVIIPRFEDAMFFLKEDNKIKLENRLERLKKINFQVSNIYEKALRLERIVGFIIDELKTKEQKFEINDQFIEKTKAAAKLCKCDLETQLVFEFTELQGEIGGIYAERQSYDTDIAKAISEHYKPRFAGDEEPETVAGKIVSIADKLDNLIANFAIGKVPKGSADPFALRRQANGLMGIIVHAQLNLNLENLIKTIIHSEAVYLESNKELFISEQNKKDGKNKKIKELSTESLSDITIKFLEQRLEFVFAIYHSKQHINKAVIETKSPLSKLQFMHKSIHLLSGLEDNQAYVSFTQAAARLASMSNSFKDFNAKELNIDESLIKDESEQGLKDLTDKLSKALVNEYKLEINFTEDDLLESVPVINKFFDNVLVNDENGAIKKNRQNLVYNLNSLFANIADFSQLKNN
ncbi:MAG: glycine--tRNA ligase subunit beta [Candidatus Caenarcaniphilales bacterium]|nr:glycine--tRNA ligase subunit beta [Candidatus Caenarcaniphilales bacterium]